MKSIAVSCSGPISFESMVLVLVTRVVPAGKVACKVQSKLKEPLAPIAKVVVFGSCGQRKTPAASEKVGKLASVVTPLMLSHKSL